MLGSYGPNPTGDPYIKNFDTEESPSGMIARSGSYNVRSRVIDDDGEVYAGMLITCRPAIIKAINYDQIGNGFSNLRKSGSTRLCTCKGCCRSLNP